MKIIAGSINIENNSTYYKVKYENGTEKTFFPYIEVTPFEVINFFKIASEQHKKTMLSVWERGK